MYIVAHVDNQQPQQKTCTNTSHRKAKILFRHKTNRWNSETLHSFNIQCTGVQGQKSHPENLALEKSISGCASINLNSHTNTTSLRRPAQQVSNCMLELGDSAESKVDSIRQNFDSINYCCVTQCWGHLWTVVCIVKCTHKITNSYFFGISCKYTAT